MARAAARMAGRRCSRRAHQRHRDEQCLLRHAISDLQHQAIADEEQKQRCRPSLERRLSRSRLGRFKSMADFDWAWPKKIDRDVVESALRLVATEPPFRRWDGRVQTRRGDKFEHFEFSARAVRATGLRAAAAGEVFRKGLAPDRGHRLRLHATLRISLA